MGWALGLTEGSGVNALREALEAAEATHRRGRGAQ